MPPLVGAQAVARLRPRGSGGKWGARRPRSKAEEARYCVQQNLPAALAAVPWLLACSGLRGKDRGRRASGTLAFARRREPLRPH